MRCSTSSTRAASVASVSPARTGTARLRDDRPGIHFRHDEMHGRAVLLRAGGERARVGVEALERRQQRRMDVEQPAVPLPHEPRRQQPHEAGEADELDAVRLQLVLQRALERLAVLAERLVIDDGGADACGRGALQVLRAAGSLETTSAISAG